MSDIQFPASLPVSEKRAEIAAAIRDHQVVVIAGETGSGKTTQIPKICLTLGYGVNRLIGHTQPRRLAARSVAARIAEELNTPLGQRVGYQVRFSDKTGPDTQIKLMTDGILLAEIQQDRLLKKYDVIIVDEAHERSLNIDFLLGYLRQLCRRRPDLKVIVTSATIDVEKFAAHFDNAPVISVSGRTFPVEILYQDPSELSGEDSDDDLMLQGVGQALRSIENHERTHRMGPGDVLVFLSGEREIRDMALGLRKQQLRDTEILPLYARLTPAEQQRIFAAHRGRRIVLSTNVAETSLTVPGIRYVIDSGMARISRYSVQSKVQRLPIEPVSQASANQRAGRCGRVESGVCIRLYSEEDFLSRPAFTDPEILRTNLSAVILQMLLLRLGDIADFPFIDAPERRAINDGYNLLLELGAIDAQRQLTHVGRQMARLPADPRLTRMLVEADKRRVLAEVLIIVSGLSVQDPRETSAENREAARARHKVYSHPESDFMSWLLLWRSVETERQNLTQRDFKKYCKENYLSWLRLREWRETHRQLLLACQDVLRPRQTMHLDLERGDFDYEAIHRALLPGVLNQIGQRNQDGQYTGCRNRRFVLFPSSVLAKKGARWVMTSELIETSRLFATQAARIEPEWVEKAASHLLKQEIFEAHWEKKRGEVIAYEKLTLAGLVLVEKRRVSFARFDPDQARAIFIREALVTGDIHCRAHFYRHNQRLIQQIRQQEDKQRRPDILISDDELATLYESVLPDSIYSVAALERWNRRQPDPQHTALHFTREQLLAREIDEDASQRAFPDKARFQNNSLAIAYRFKPGAQDDGVSISVPLALLPQLTQRELDWAVPGLLQERCVALVRGLPKALRKRLVPVPDFVSAALAAADPAQQPLLTDLLAMQAWRQFQVRITPTDWSSVDIPGHLLPAIKVQDAHGKIVGQGQDLEALKRELQPQVAHSNAALNSHPIEVQGLTDWTLDTFPSDVEIRQGVAIVRYPALVDKQQSVDVVLCESPEHALSLTERGLARLYLLRTPQQRTLILKALKDVEKALGLKLAGLGKEWQGSALLTVYRLAFQVSDIVPRDKLAFEQQLQVGKASLMDTAARVCRLLTAFFEERYVLQGLLKERNTRFPEAVAAINAQLAFLVTDDFPESVPAQWLWEYPRYLKAIQQRLEKLASQPDNDMDMEQQITGLFSRWQRQPEAERNKDPEFPWWLQELRVSLFAQQLGTKGPVSIKRLERRLA